MIFSLLDEDDHDDDGDGLSSALAFGTTSSYFWDLGKHFLSSLITRRSMNPKLWAGDRIICIGGMACDLPSGFPDEGEGSIDDYFIRLFYDEFPYPENIRHTIPHWYRCERQPQFKPWAEPFCIPDRRSNVQVPDPTSEEWILRNLSKREYTRQTEDDHGDFALWRGYVGPITLILEIPVEISTLRRSIEGSRREIDSMSSPCVIYRG